MHKILYTEKAREDLRTLSISIQHRIVKKIHVFSLQKNPLLLAKRLKDARLGQYRFRIGDYRALFDIDHKEKIHILIILRIKHRKDIYDI